MIFRHVAHFERGIAGGELAQHAARVGDIDGIQLRAFSIRGHGLGLPAGVELRNGCGQRLARHGTAVLAEAADGFQQVGPSGSYWDAARKVVTASTAGTLRPVSR